MRLFFALWPDADVRARIAAAAAQLSAAIDGARWVPRDSYHLTLTFIGEASAPQFAALRQIGARQRAVCCTVQLDTYDIWPNSQVLVAASLAIPSALSDLSARLRMDIAQHSATSDLPRVEPPLRPHVTLARKVAQASVPQAMSPFCWTARSFSLVRSDRRATGSAYTVVDTWQLLDESAAS